MRKLNEDAPKLDRVTSAIRDYPADQMRMWEISPRINSPKNDDPLLWETLRLGRAKTEADTLEAVLVKNTLELVREDTLSDRDA
jgi:hypothetical protein